MSISKDEVAKAEILEAAKRVFKKWGVNKTTMEDIAREAGKGKSTLYYYYKSKDEIFEKFVSDEFNTIIVKAKYLVSGESSSKVRLRKYIATVLSEAKKTVSFYPIVRGEIKGNPKFINKMKKQLDAKEEAFILEILNNGLENGEFRFLKKDELDKAANVVVGTIRGLSLYLFLDNDDIEKIDIITRMMAEGI